MIKAEVILDSISPNDDRLTTFLLRYPKFIHQDLLTHRVFSRSASSARAVPARKMIEEAESWDFRAQPARWVAEEPGMQGYTDLAGRQLAAALEIWEEAALDACKHARRLITVGAHKQHINRVIEPYIHINVVVTATEFMNFFGLRLDGGADPTLQALAVAAWQAYRGSTPKLMQPGKWHLPFFERAKDLPELSYGGREADEIVLSLGQKISAARCARTSYTSYKTGKRSESHEDVELYLKLMGKQPLHASPAEHQATPDQWLPKHNFGEGCWAYPEHHGNFTGWRQFRKMLHGEAIAPLPSRYQEELS